MLVDVGFVKESVLKEYLEFEVVCDTFLLRPVMVLENKLLAGGYNNN